MKKEIEVKAKIKDLGSVRSTLENLGCVFSDSVTQDDIYFVNFDDDFSVFKTKANFLRIRKTRGKIIFTLKQPQSNELDCIEKEFEISDEQQCREAIEIMGYHEVVRVSKTRARCSYNGIEISLDDVQGLGAFIEVERITDEDANKVQDELFTFLQTLGVNKDDKIMQGYDTQIYIKNNRAK